MDTGRPDPLGPADPDEPGVHAVEPHLDPEVEAHVRELLAAAPDPGPMPEVLVERISVNLADEELLRIEPGPLTQADHDNAVLGPLIRQRQRPRPLFALAAVAAAAGVIALGGSALHLNKGANGSAVIDDGTTATIPVVRPPGTSPAAVEGLHIHQTRDRWTPDNLVARATALPGRPDAPWSALTAQWPVIGSLISPDGVTSCLTGLGIADATPVHVDLADWGKDPAAIIVATRAGTTTVHVVNRDCSAQSSTELTPAVTLP